MITENLSTKRISGTLLMSLAAMAVNYLISLVLTSYITENMGAVANGFVALTKTISNYAIIFTSCLNTFASRFITVSYHKKDFDKANSYYSSVFYANICLSVIVLLISGVGIIFLDKWLNVPPDLIREVRILLLLDVLNYMLLATGSCFSTYAYISDRLDLMNAIKFGAYSIEALILIALFWCFEPSIVYVGIGLLFSSVLLIGANLCATKRFTPLLAIRSAFFELGAVNDLFLGGIWSSINNIGNLLQSGLDLIVSNLMLSSLAMSQLSLVKTLYTIFATLFQLLASSFHPSLLRAYSSGDINGVVSTLKTSMKISGLFSMLIFSGFVAMGKVYYALWTPSQDASLLYTLTVAVFLGSILEGLVYPLFYIYTLTVKLKVPCILTVISGLINVLSKYVLIKYFDFGLMAVVLTTTILGWVMYLIFTPLYSAKCLKCSPKLFYPTILKTLCVGALLTMCAVIIGSFPWQNNWISFIFGCVVVVAVCIPIYFVIIFSKEERKRFLRAIPIVGKRI